MVKYILKRLLQMVIVLILVSIATFFLTDLVPGDVVYIVAGTDEIDQAAYDVIYEDLGLDKPLVQRFFEWTWDIIHLDFGKSYIYSKPVLEIIAPRMAVTMYLSFLTLIISIPIGVVLGVITAVKRKTKTDTVITLLANACNCLPQFFIGIVLLYVFSLKLRLLPATNFDWPWNVGLWEHIKCIIMPVICLALGCVAGFTRQTRSSMLEVIRQDFMRTAYSKGLSNKKVYFKHMLKNGLIPIITVIGNRLTYLIGGTMFVETVFSISGTGTLAVKSVQNKDIPMIQMMVLVTALIVCLTTIITDILYVCVDPRISLTDSSN